ncbi:MAG: PKD domain-containing protein, partial [Cyclobacteriaceae bacterium]|nr:PKD domain-containing protein [Cyclobacteriaceae bacterium]
MGYRIIFFALALLVFFPRGVQGQCVTIDYNLPSSACLNENLYITNTTPSGSYSWDFCTGDFSNTPSASLFFGIELASGRPGFDLVKDGAIWYGFFTGTTSNLLFRVTFGSGLNSAPTVTENLGNLGGTLNAPGQIRIVNENGLWFGLIHNTGTGDLVKLSFGTSLSNPVTTSLLNVGVAHGNGGFGVGRDVANGWVCVFSNTSNQFTIVRLGTTISSPQPSDILISSTVPAAILGDVEVSNVCGNWYAFASDFAGGRVFRASFGSNLFSIPTASQISTVPAANLGRIKFVKDGENHSLLVSALDGLFFKLDFGTDPTSTPVLDNEGNVGGGLPPNIYALDAVKETSIWTIITSSQGTGNAFKISYPNVCSAVAQTSLLQYPQVKFSSPSTFNVSLDYTNAGVVTTKTKSILIKSLVPPDIDFNSQNSCVSNPVNFSPINSSGGLTSYQWDFGDMNTATVSNPSNVYAIAASYTVVLTVSSSNSCSNTVVKPIAIYNSPIADFTIPSVNPFCTNQNYSFSNISGFDVGSNPSWEWRLNGLLISTQQNLSTPFMSATSQEIRLRAIIPGCSNEMIKTIPIVKAGPQVNFSVNDNCQNSQVLFTNNTGGVNTSYAWDFGDGGTSSQVSPTYSYSSANTFQSKLTVSNADGCQNFLIKPVRIYSLPQPDFSVSLPPFSCANSSTPFQNNTPPLTDSDLANWVWQFGDAVGGTSVDLSPSYTYAQSGNYSVTLTSTS